MCEGKKNDNKLQIEQKWDKDKNEQQKCEKQNIQKNHSKIEM